MLPPFIRKEYKDLILRSACVISLYSKMEARVGMSTHDALKLIVFRNI